MRRFLSLTSALIASAMILHSEAFCAQQIGVAAAVNNQVEGLSGSSARRLATGSGVFENERVRTGAASTAQLLFLDKTTVNIGPRAELTLDKFVFDPNRGRGQVALDLVRGTVRFATGSQNPTNYSIKTPVASLGIRGTMAVISQGFIGVFEGVLRGRTIRGQDFYLAAGWAIRFDANGNMYGPFKWNITDTEVAGWPYVGDPANYILPNNGGIDQLNAIDARGFIPRLPIIIGD